MKVLSKMDFSWDNIQFKRGFEYEISITDKFKEFIKCGYLKEQNVDLKEEKTERKTKEFKGNKKTK